MTGTARRFWLAMVLAGAVLTGCSPHSGPARIEVDHPAALADTPLHIRIAGLPAGDPVQVSAEAGDRTLAQDRWRAHAQFTVGDDGTVDLTRAKASHGTYSGVDGMGLFWSMVPPYGDPDAAFFAEPWPSWQVRITASAGGKTLATRDVTRALDGPGHITTRTLAKAADGVSGLLFTPARITGGPVLIFGGSEGGNAVGDTAFLLAAHGHPALSLTYFRDEGLPPTLRDVPLECFAAAARLLSPHAPVSVIGSSRGTEAAQLLAENFPELVRAVVLYAPGDQVVGSFPRGGDAWLLGGQPVLTTTIPLDRVRGPILTVAGGADGLWGSEAASWRIKERHPSTTSLTYPDAGHLVGTFPYDATGIRIVNPTSHKPAQLGGTRGADAHARADSWPRVLAFLAKAT